MCKNICKNGEIQIRRITDVLTSTSCIWHIPWFNMLWSWQGNWLKVLWKLYSSFSNFWWVYLKIKKKIKMIGKVLWRKFTALPCTPRVWAPELRERFCALEEILVLLLYLSLSISNTIKKFYLFPNSYSFLFSEILQLFTFPWEVSRDCVINS